mmetsp:Transcript_31153/g.43341  ORF Transcript_31153/g.43341 Transcript_31153/m.43341 type:complete len:310 (-) Transcript_31153:140-1069(-)
MFHPDSKKSGREGMFKRGFSEGGYNTTSGIEEHEKKFSNIQDVYADNLQEEMDKIVEIVEDYPYVAIDTEFPGVVAKPVGKFNTSSEYRYRQLKCNVDLLNIIQLGISFYDKNGKRRPGVCTWQFNFKFNLEVDMYAQDSIDLLTKSGLNFKLHEEKGINVNEFGALLITSGLVLTDDVCWISFHGGYDYGYLLKVLTNNRLPEKESEFFELYHTFFIKSYDLKYMMKSCEDLKGGLDKLADDLKVVRIGPQHQAGSDSLLTAASFFSMREQYFENMIDEDKFMGVLYGLGEGGPSPSPKTQRPVNAKS